MYVQWQKTTTSSSTGYVCNPTRTVEVDYVWIQLAPYNSACRLYHTWEELNLYRTIRAHKPRLRIVPVIIRKQGELSATSW